MRGDTIKRFRESWRRINGHFKAVNVLLAQQSDIIARQAALIQELQDKQDDQEFRPPLGQSQIH